MTQLLYLLSIQWWLLNLVYCLYFLQYSVYLVRTLTFYEVYRCFLNDEDSCEQTEDGCYDVYKYEEINNRREKLKKKYEIN